MGSHIGKLIFVKPEILRKISDKVSQHLLNIAEGVIPL